MESSAPDGILYELFVYSEWRPDPDFVRGEITSKTNSGQSMNHFINLLKPEQTLIDHVANYIDQLQSWQICLGDDGMVVAIIQDNYLEIRTKRGNFSSAVAKAGITRDPNPQWRKMAWSTDCSMLAVAHSNGKVSFYDLLATNLFNIQPDCSQPPELQCTDTTHAIAGIVFLTNRIVDQKWSSELLLVDFKGALRSYFVSPTDGFKLYHKYNFDGGISTLSYHRNHNMIFVTGLPSTLTQESNKSNTFGLRGWRLLNDPPFYKISADFQKEPTISYLSWFLYYLPLWKKSNQSVITKSVISSNGSLLACIHIDGSISIWRLPILKLSHIWPLTMQTDFDIPNPLTLNGKSKGWPPLKKGFSEFAPIDLSWWNDDALIVSRLNGSVSICSISDLHNMLTSKPVFLQGHPQISLTFDNGFLSIECESVLIPAKKLRRTSESTSDSISNLNEIAEEEGSDSYEVEKVSFASKSKEIIKTILYIITDMERFQPKPKQLNLLSKIYRLLCLKSTTPEDLYLRKIENAEYSEALILAETYKLDSDHVYQQQWRCSKVSSQTIKDYLSKVSKKIWVIQQCCDRVPETLSAAKELLEFGLKITNKEIYNGLETKEDKQTYYEKKLWDNISLSDLSSQNTEILRYRYTMLHYLDRLEIYKSIIRSEFSIYSSEEYNRLRSNTMCRSAIEFAREGRVEALVCLWPNLTNLSLQLLVLQNLPETLDPSVYNILLPKYGSEEATEQHKAMNRDEDWCEKEIFRSIWSSIGIDEFNLDDTFDDITVASPPSTNLTEWYSKRARQIEEMSGLTSHSLTLIAYAIEKNVPGLEELHSLLTTLDILLYDINIEPITLSQLEKYSQFQIANHLMSKTNHESIINDIKMLLIPYLERHENLTSNLTIKDSLMKEYILYLSKKDLSLALIIFRELGELGFNVQQCLDFANDCFLLQDSNKNISLCFDILETLPEVSDNSITPSYHIKAIDIMERLLHACNLFENHGVQITFSQLKFLMEKPKELQELLVQMARNSSNVCISASDWNDLLQDILQLHSLIFYEVNNELCHEIFATSMLSSASKASIASAEQVLICNPSNGTNNQTTIKKNKFSYKLSVSHKIPHKKSISLVLESARDYYDSSSSLNDPSLEFAWACLQLIDDNVEIQLEKDLISALKILNSFELSVLPVQIRLFPSKIEFIEECLNCNENAYKNTEKVLQLATLLRVAEEDARKKEALIVSLCAIKSTEAKDYEEAKKLGKRLVSVCEGPTAVYGVNAAQELGSNSNILDLPLRHQLLNIALLHCEAKHLETLIMMRSTVESEILQSEINNLINMTHNQNSRQVNLQDSMESTEDDYVDALTSPIVENKLITAVQAVEKYIQKPLNKNYWKNSLNFSWMSNANKASSPKSVVKNTGKLACHAFYVPLHPDCHISSLGTHYDSIQNTAVREPQLVMLYSLIRNSTLQDCIKYGECDTSYVEAFIQCAQFILTEDTAYCISHLLSVCNDPNFDKYMQIIDFDIKNVHTFLYFYALMNYASSNPMPEEGFLMSPTKLISEAFMSIKREENPNKTLKNIQYCKNIMTQLIEGKKLVKLGCNIDIELFAQDSVYRRDTILILAKTHDDEIYQLASKLAKKYNIKEQELVMNYLTYAILQYESSNFAESLKKVTNSAITEVLTEDAANVNERFTTEVWEKLDGKDHNGMILYFTLVDSINSRHLVNGLNAKEHIKLIKKTKSACSGLNYKTIISNCSQNDMFDNMISLINKDNIGLITKLLRNMPPNLNINFNTSRFYCDWLLMYFYNIPESIHSSKKWMQQHRECSSYFSKLNKEDLLSFTRNILFGDLTLQKVPASTRIQIAFQTADYCQHEHSNMENISNNKQNDDQNWEDIALKINKWAKFLECFHCDVSKQIILSSSMVEPQIWRDLEQSQGDESKLIEYLTELTLNNSISVKNLLLFLTSINVNITMDSILLRILETEELNASNLSRITQILMNMKLTQSIDAELLSKIKVHTTSTLLTSKQRLDLMSLFKIHMDNDNSEMLEKISLEMIQSTWDGECLSDIEELTMSDPCVRNNIFIKLIQCESNWEKLKTLVDLVNMWPSQMQNEDKSTKPPLLLAKSLLNNDQHLEDNLPLLRLLMSKQQFNEDDIRWIVSVDSRDNIFGKIWLCMLSSDEKVNLTVFPNLAFELKKLDDIEKHLSDSLMSEILKKGLLISIVKSAIYPKLIQHLLQNPSDYSVERAIDDLMEKNYIVEAGSLKMSAMGIPQTLRTFSQALFLRKT